MQNFKKLLVTAVGIFFLSYVGYVVLIISKGVEHQILIAVDDGSYPVVPHSIGYVYLRYGPNPKDWESDVGNTAISYASAGLGIGANTEKTYDLIKMLVNRGADINKRSIGLAPIHEAVLYADLDLMRLYMELGANLKTPIERKGSLAHGLNALEFSVLLATKAPEKYEPVVELLSQ